VRRFESSPRGLGLNYGKALDCLEVGITANQRCVYGEGGCSDPEVVLVEWQAAALLARLHLGILIASDWRNGLARQHGKKLSCLILEISAASPRRQPLQTEQDLAASDGTEHYPVINSN
jgi:hypothetical protein